MWRLCALGALLVAPIHVRSSVCDDGQSNIYLDLPNESVYLCHRDHIPPSSQVYPSIATKYKEEETYHACMDVQISHVAPIPNSGAHRPLGAKYGEYIYCPPPRWVHNLQHAGVAFLYHPCVDSQLKKALSFVARSCVPRHIITPLPSLSRERPIALVTWCSTLEMSHINVTEIKYWLKENIRHERQDKTIQNEAYQHLLVRPSLISENSAELCRERDFQMLHHFLNHGGLSTRRLLRKRRAVLPTPVVQDVISLHASASISSSVLAGQHKDKTIPKQSAVSQPTVASGLTSSTEPFTLITSVSLTQKSHPQDIKPDIHSREAETNGMDNMTELPIQKIMPTQLIQSLVIPDGNVTQPFRSNVPKEASKEQPSQARVTQKDHHVDTPLNETSVNAAPKPNPTLQSRHRLTDPMLSLTATEKKQLIEQKQECSCQHDTEPETSLAQRRLGGSQRKLSEGFVSTPRTDEATWAAASLIFLFSLLTFSILYTQIYKKFRKSQSLYWTSEINSEEKETVASIIKRRLVQGHTRRKKWFGKKTTPTVLYESLSESSD